MCRGSQRALRPWQTLCLLDSALIVCQALLPHVTLPFSCDQAYAYLRTVAHAFSGVEYFSST